MPRYYAVIFDHDGTLVDSEPVHLQMWQQLLKPRVLPRETYENQLSGIPSIESSRWLIEHFNLNEDPEHFLQKKLTLLNRYLERQACPLLAGISELVSHLQKHRIPMAIASGAMGSEVERSLSFHQLQAAFHTVATGDRVNNNKPAPDVYLLAAKNLNLAPEQCIAIEDSDSGHKSALAAGMICVRLKTASTLPPQKNTVYVDNIAEARRWLNIFLEISD